MSERSEHRITRLIHRLIKEQSDSMSELAKTQELIEKLSILVDSVGEGKEVVITKKIADDMNELVRAANGEIGWLLQGPMSNKEKWQAYLKQF